MRILNLILIFGIIALLPQMGHTDSKQDTPSIPEAERTSSVQMEDGQFPDLKTDLPNQAIPLSKSQDPKELISTQDGVTENKSNPTKEKSDQKNKKTSSKKKVKPIEAKPLVKGVAFVNALIKPINYEVNERFWGWRPNDILNFTDNVNNLQRGVLEVTRRAAVVLAGRISRTGSNDAFDENLENAMNWFMVKADKYWFPSPESKYNEGIAELQSYIKRLEKKRVRFYSRTDNLIPLLMAFEDLLGSCDKNLIKKTDENGNPIGSSQADDIFYYAKGVAIAILSILEGVSIDFGDMLSSVQGCMDVLEQAIEACQSAITIDPALITEGDLSSIYANHRANIAQPLNQARFHIGVLIRALQGY